MNVHKSKFRVMYVDVDQMSQVHNSKYQVFFEEARINLVRENGYPYSQIEKDGLIFPISECKLLYKLPLRYDDEFIVETRVEYIKNFSMKFIYNIKNLENNDICTGYTIHACLDKTTLDFIEVPEKLKLILNKYKINN